MAEFKRKLKNQPAKAFSLRTDSLQKVGLQEWLQRRAKKFNNLKWLLAHAYDGVIWGRLDNGNLVTSYKAARNHPNAQEFEPAELRLETLQQACLFAAHAELLLWRDGDNRWQARVIQDIPRIPADADTEAVWEHCFDQPQLLWGDHGVHLAHDFTLLSDGAQGLRHAVPFKLSLQSSNTTKPLFLQVRHYLSRTGFARVVASRLWGLDQEGHQLNVSQGEQQ
jgi:CRISPR-associated protein (TIGR03984 family)